jgi:hypothetical protein
MPLILAWLMLLALLIFLVIGRRSGLGALTLGYFLSISLIHVPGLLVFATPGPEMPYAAETELGFQITLIAMAAFVAGAAGARVMARRRSWPEPAAARVRAEIAERIGVRAILIGAFCYFVVLPVIRLIPSLTSLFSGLGAFLLLGIWLRLYGTSLVPHFSRKAQTLCLLPLLPISTLLTGGVINYGINWLISGVAFAFTISRARTLYVAMAPIAMFLGLSLFVVYMDQRPAIRESVWEERASLSQRAERAMMIITEFRPLDLQGWLDRSQLDGRLNFNEYLGIGVQRYENGQFELEYGGTIDPTALIPRAIWPDKPFRAGGGTLVSDFTGIANDPTTVSIGAGQVLEFYMNFALEGVIGGFLGLGFLFMWLDDRIARALSTADVRSVILYGLPGLNMIAPGGNLLETLVAVVAALVTARVLVALPFFQVTGRPTLAQHAQVGVPGASQSP